MNFKIFQIAIMQQILYVISFQSIPILTKSCYNMALHTGCKQLNSMAPGRCGSYFRSMIFKLNVHNGHSLLRWMPHNLTNEMITLIQVMAYCHQATNHYLKQCWLRSMSSYGVTRPNWVIVKHVSTLKSQKALHALPSQAIYGMCMEDLIFIILIWLR